MTASVIDTTVLSNFAHIRQPQLIAFAYKEPVTVNVVAQELNEGMTTGRLPKIDWSWLPVLSLTPSELVVASDLEKRIDRGEAACIAVILARQGTLVTDDRPARKLAAELNIAVSGTVGTLLALIKGNVLTLSQADYYLETMRQMGYHSPVASLKELLPP